MNIENLQDLITAVAQNDVSTFKEKLHDIVNAKMNTALETKKQEISHDLLTKEDNIEEKITKDTSAGEIISDFVHSDNPKFEGKSKKERTKMALGAYYSKHPEKSNK